MITNFAPIPLYTLSNTHTHTHTAVCDPPCLNGACIATNTCSCSVSYTGVRCDTSLAMDCDVSPCENNGSCALLAGSYICTCPFNYNGVNCQNPGMSIWYSQLHKFCCTPRSVIVPTYSQTLSHIIKCMTSKLRMFWENVPPSGLVALIALSGLI